MSWVRTKFLLICFILGPFVASGQKSLNVYAAMVWSNIKVKDNWTPSTAPSYKEYLNGSAFGYGFNLNYSFQPKLLIKNRNFSISIGGGYFLQRFEVIRPFNYYSPVEIIFYTDYYSYHCLQWTGGLTYSYPLNKYNLKANISYGQSYSFRQEYTPTRKDFSTQMNSNKIDFGKMLSFNIGIDRYFGDRFLMGFYVLTPVYTRWRNDKIFNDDPTTFHRPESSLGLSIRIGYCLQERDQP